MNALYLSLFNKIDFKRIIDHPNILIAAAFWEEDRYMAARICYKYLRAIDDLIDGHKSRNSIITGEEKEQFITNVNSWLQMIKSSDANGITDNDLITTIRRFHIPVWPMEAFAKSMIYDINHNGFKTIDSYIDYAQGASVAPASIFVHLNGLIKEGDEYHLPRFNVKKAATPCAIFSYIVHIIRDFQKDQLNHLNYFADAEIIKNGLSHNQLRKIAEGEQIPDGFRKMIGTYYDLATEYKQQTYDVIKEITPLLQPRYRLSLAVIFSLYLMVYERINIKEGFFTGEELNPTPEEIKEKVYRTIDEFK